MSPPKTAKSELDELFTVVNNEVTWLHTVWELLIQLYGSSDENIDLMNASAPQFFSLLQIMMFDELVLILNRLTDRVADIRGNTNASLEQLIEQTDQDRDAKLVDSLKRKLKNIRTNYIAFRTWSDKRVSHNDLSTALRNESDALPEITRGQAEAAVRDIADFMDEFSIAIKGGSQAYVPFLTAHGDGNALMDYLKQASKSHVTEAFTGPHANRSIT